MTVQDHNAFLKTSDAIHVTHENLKAIVRGLPAKAKIALSAAVGLPKGSLVIRTPEGRVLKVGGRAAGPDAEVHLHNWNLPKRAFSEATIGVAESYMDGDWSSPDVTTFLELFLDCENKKHQSDVVMFLCFFKYKILGSYFVAMHNCIT